MSTSSIEKAILPRGFIASPFGLVIDENISEENFAKGCTAITQLAGFAQQTLFYWLGDLINAGERLFPNKYEQWVNMTGYTYGYLRNASYVCAHVPPEIRKRCPTIQHAMAMAKLDPETQEKAALVIEKENLSSTEFRRYLRGEVNYKRNAVPEAKKSTPEELFERFWSIHGDRIGAIVDTKEMAKKVWLAGYAAGKKGGQDGEN
jgi:hypothetical protein